MVMACPLCRYKLSDGDEDIVAILGRQLKPVLSYAASFEQQHREG